MTLKRFLLFAGIYYYPSGGWNDFYGSFDTVEEATAAYEAYAKDKMDPWGHIFDAQTGTPLNDFGRQPFWSQREDIT